jgi:LmbE family N-acetylglucosaminyl deacetylase
MKKKILIIEAHSDDSAISSLGLLNKFKELYEFHFVLITASDVMLNHYSKLITKEQRIIEYKNYVDYFCGIWHKDDFIPCDYDSRLDTVSKSILVKSIDKIIDKVRPNLLIFQGPSFHHDHTIVYESVITSLRPNGSQLPEQMLVMENPTHVHSLETTKNLKPNFYCSLSNKEITTKIELFKQFFPSQIRNTLNCLSMEGLISWAKYRGLECRKDYAEAFYSYKTILL